MPPRDHWREFPRELNSIEEIPPTIWEAIKSYLTSKDQVIHAYLIPQQRGFWEWFHDAPPRNNVFVLTRDEVIIARETRDSGVDVERCALGDLITFEVGTVLLNSWIRLTAANSHGTHDYRLEYGTVFERHFRDCILWLRTLPGMPTEPPRHLWRMPGEEYIKALPLKFNNAARNYWLQGESALAACFIKPLFVPIQLPIQLPIVNRLRRTYACATAIVVSDREISVIIEQGMSNAGRWGQAWHFCPLSRIAEMRVIEGEPFPKLHIAMVSSPAHPASLNGRPHSEIEISFDPDQRPEIERIAGIAERYRTLAVSHAA